MVNAYNAESLFTIGLEFKYVGIIQAQSGAELHINKNADSWMPVDTTVIKFSFYDKKMQINLKRMESLWKYKIDNDGKVYSCNICIHRHMIIVLLKEMNTNSCQINHVITYLIPSMCHGRCSRPVLDWRLSEFLVSNLDHLFANPDIQPIP